MKRKELNTRRRRRRGSLCESECLRLSGSTSDSLEHLERSTGLSNPCETKEGSQLREGDAKEEGEGGSRSTAAPEPDPSPQEIYFLRTA